MIHVSDILENSPVVVVDDDVVYSGRRLAFLFLVLFVALVRSVRRRRERLALKKLQQIRAKEELTS